MKIRQLCAFLLLVSSLCLLFGCASVNGNGVHKTVFFETLEENYTLVIKDLAIKGYTPHLTIDKKGQNRVEVQADENVLTEVNVDINNEKHIITISADPKSSVRPTYFAITLSCPIKKVEMDGDYLIDWMLPQVRNFSAVINGNCEGTIINQELYKYDLTINGKGKIKASGKAEKFTLDINGNTDFEAYTLETTASCKINLKGKGDVQITANGSLYADIIGNGTITYDGSPVATTKFVDGKGKILSRADARENAEKK